MNVTVNEVDQHKVTLHIEVPAKDASKQAAAACKNLASRVNIPGFRKGKAPRMVLESFLGKDAVKQEVFEAIANKAYSDALDQEGIVPVTEPELNVITDEKAKMSYSKLRSRKTGSQTRRIQRHHRCQR